MLRQMDPVTHLLTGAVLARAGLNRKAAYATTAMIIAAEFPDVDTAWSVFGPVTGFQHHRGITHTFVGLPFEAALVVGGFWVLHRWWKAPQWRAPVNWGWLYAGCLLALLSHLLLDWTNNYGIRPFFPFNARWYAGSFVFIVEPVLLALLAGALVLPWLFGLINAEVGARKPKFAGRGWAMAGLVGVAALYVLRSTEHGKALAIAAQNQPPDTERIFASPEPTNPFVWHVVLETPRLYQRMLIDTHRELVQPASPVDTFYKPETTLALLAAKRTYLGEVYLDWSMFPVLSEGEVNDDPRHPLTAVTFTDMRFLYDTALLRTSGRTPPLGATVILDMAAPEGQRVVEMTMGGRVQK